MKTLLIGFVTGTLMLVFGFTTYSLPEGENLSQQDTTQRITGAALFQQNCAACHGTDLQGRPPAFPSLKEVKSHMTKEQITTLLKTGRNNMPSFEFLTREEKNSIYLWLKTLEKEAPPYRGMMGRCR